MRACLSVEELAIYIAGATLVDRHELEGHVDACEACRCGVAAAMRAARLSVHRFRSVARDPIAEPVMPPYLPVRDPMRYRVGDQISRGGMGRIVWADDLELGRRIAIKELLPSGAGVAKRFER